MATHRALLLLCAAIACISCCYGASVPMPRNTDSRLDEDSGMEIRKRPFCNAFTGCGRKRSQRAPGMPVQELIRQRQYDEDSLAPLFDSENTIDELSRQILSEAKLWEAIQQASAEIARRKQKDVFYNN